MGVLALIEAIRSQDSGRLLTFACNHNADDISNENTDIVSFNTYPGWIGTNAGTFENQKRLIDADVAKIVARYRRLYGVGARRDGERSNSDGLQISARGLTSMAEFASILPFSNWGRCAPERK